MILRFASIIPIALTAIALAPPVQAESFSDHLNTGYAMARQNRWDDAIIHYQRAVDSSEIASCNWFQAQAGLVAAATAKQSAVSPPGVTSKPRSEFETFEDAAVRLSTAMPRICFL